MCQIVEAVAKIITRYAIIFLCRDFLSSRIGLEIFDYIGMSADFCRIGITDFLVGKELLM